MSVSVICTVKNAEATIAETLASIQAQDIGGWEMVVVDDGSRDHTAAIVAGLAAADPRIRLIRTGGVGRGHALNLALQEARFALVANIDADDPSHPRRLGLQQAAMLARPEIVVLCTDFIIVRDDEPCRWEPVPAPPPVRDVTRVLLRTNPIAHSSVMMRTEIVRGLGGYRKDLPTHVDFDLWIRLVAAGHRLGRLEACLASKRQHAGQSFERRRRLAYLAASARMQARAIRTLGSPPYLPLVPVRFLWGLMPEMLRRHVSRLVR